MEKMTAAELRQKRMKFIKLRNAGFNQKEIAAEIGISPRSIGKWQKELPLISFDENSCLLHKRMSEEVKTGSPETINMLADAMCKHYKAQLNFHLLNGVTIA